MERTKLSRLCALFLALLFLIPGGVISAAATGVDGNTSSSDGTSVSDKSIEDVREQLNAISYDEYSKKYASVGRAKKEIIINGVDYDKATTNADVKKETYDGIEALTIPDTGTVSWPVSIPETGKYSVIILYYPIEHKSASIQRIFRIDGTIPFAESRYITMTKVWKNEYSDGEFLLGKKENAADYLSAAKSMNIEATAEEREDGTYIVYKMPDYWTQDISELVDSKMIRFFTNDIDNNELRNSMKQSPVWCSYELKDVDGFYTESFEFVLTAGEHTISLEGVNEPVAIKSILLVPHKDLLTYDEYISQYQGEAKGSSVVKIEAEFPSASSTQTVYPIEDRSCAINSPTDPTRMVLNTIGSDKWQTSGQWLEYKMRVDNSGLYRIDTRYQQKILDGIYTSRVMSIYSDGLTEGAKGYYNGVPFQEAAELVFNYSTEWQSGSLKFAVKTTGADGNVTTEYRDIELYFEAGVTYTIRFEVALGSMGDIVRQLNESIRAINNDYLEILKLTGATPDQYRDYGFYRIMPDTIIDLKIQADILEGIANELSATSGVKSTNAATLEKVIWLLRRMHGDEDEIARNLDQLKSYLGTLGTLLTSSKTQPLQLDFIVIQSSDMKIPKAKPNFFQSFGHEMTSFFMSFIRNYNRMGATTDTTEESSDSVEVWLATGRDQAQVVRNLINNDFSPVYGYAVNLKLVAASTLLPSILADSGPDVYIGLSEENVINYAIRGALLNIENYDGFYDLAINKDTRVFNEAAMMVLGIGDADGVDHYYGLPENQSFPMMFIRTDILADLNIEIPKTWDDILEAVPILQANNMEIGLANDYKVFLYQMGGTLFADEGMRINLDSNTALESFEKMCNMFTMYSFPYKYDFANRFRTGEMPIGIASYIGTYNQLVVYATEIRGLWQFVPLPGIEDENGNVNNVSVSTVSAIVMINGISNVDGAWAFMKWHVGEKCQSDYANEMVALLGDSAKHSTANLKALESLPWTAEEARNVELQFNNLASIPNYPGAYIIGRYTQFAFLNAYNYNKDPVAGILKYITTINKEITKKRKEFDLETLTLGQTKAQKRIDQVLGLLDDITASSSYSTAYDSIINGARAAIASGEASAMIVAAESLRGILNTIDPQGTIAAGEITSVKAKEGCYNYDVYKYATELATKVYYAAEFLNDAGVALNSYVD